MPLSLEALRDASSRYYRVSMSRTLTEAQAAHDATAFLSHSHEDKDLAKGLQVLLREEGWQVYLDWEDPAMQGTPTKETAERVKLRITACRWFLFLATPNAMTSRWCPWEIGVADRAKPSDSVLIVPTTDRSGSWHGSEYLKLYRQIELTTRKTLAVFMPGQDTGGVSLRSL